MCAVPSAPLVHYVAWLSYAGAAAVEWWFGVDTEGKSLEDVASPLSTVRE
jgi:hypothetical protein